MAKHPKMRGTLAERAFAETYRVSVLDLRDQTKKTPFGDALVLLAEERVVQFALDYHKVSKVFTPHVNRTLFYAMKQITEYINARGLLVFDTTTLSVRLGEQARR